MDTPLRLEDYFFPHISSTADPKYSSTDDEEILSPDVKVELKGTDNPNVFQLALDISIELQGEGHNIPYFINLVTIGIFSVAENWDNKEKLLKVTGASMLYGAAREFLITITSRGPWPPFKLPTYSFLTAYIEQNKETNQSKKQGKS
jgi:preprotein translocase subunit SecB